MFVEGDALYDAMLGDIGHAERSVARTKPRKMRWSLRWQMDAAMFAAPNGQFRHKGSRLGHVTQHAAKMYRVRCRTDCRQHVSEDSFQSCSASFRRFTRENS